MGFANGDSVLAALDLTPLTLKRWLGMIIRRRSRRMQR